MFTLSIEEARNLLSSYDAEIQNQQKNLDAICSLRALLAEKVNQMEVDISEQAHGFGS